MLLVVRKPTKAAECNLEQSKSKGSMKLALRVTKKNSLFVVMEPARETYLKKNRRWCGNLCRDRVRLKVTNQWYNQVVRPFQSLVHALTNILQIYFWFLRKNDFKITFNLQTFIVSHCIIRSRTSIIHPLFSVYWLIALSMYFKEITLLGYFGHPFLQK